MFAILKSLSRKWVGRRKISPTAGPLGLEPNQVEGLEGLIQQPLWRHWQAVLETLLEQRLQRLASGLEHTEYLKVSGETRLLIQLAHLPETLIATERKRDEREQPVESPSNPFVNSPFFGTVAGPGNGTSVGGR